MCSATRTMRRSWLASLATIRRVLLTRRSRAMARPIYPVPIKPRTRINRWGDWPKDCVEQIRKLVRGWYPTGGVFKCADCEAFCEPHPHGVPHVGGQGWKGEHGYP